MDGQTSLIILPTANAKADKRRTKLEVQALLTALYLRNHMKQ
jgi:hypothetical protein